MDLGTAQGTTRWYSCTASHRYVNGMKLEPAPVADMWRCCCQTDYLCTMPVNAAQLWMGLEIMSFPDISLSEMQTIKCPYNLVLLFQL
jgi:hypothetical protein